MSKLPIEGDEIMIFDLLNEEELTASSEHASPLPSSFQSLAADTAFTFTATPHPIISDIKHPKDHVNAPTPMPSPMKKRARTGSEPSPHVNTPTLVPSPTKEQVRTSSERLIVPALRFSEPPSPRRNNSLRNYESDSGDDDMDEGHDNEPAQTSSEARIVPPLRFAVTPSPRRNNSSRNYESDSGDDMDEGDDDEPARIGSEPRIIPSLRFSELPSAHKNNSSDMPALRNYESDSGDDDMDEGDDDEPDGPRQTVFIPSPHTSKPTKQTKLGLFWKAETKDEREERQQRDSEKFRLATEARQKAVEEEKQRKVRDKRLKQNTRQQKHRDREREEKIANGWVPGQPQ
jgi:hypothetical protein